MDFISLFGVISVLCIICIIYFCIYFLSKDHLTPEQKYIMQNHIDIIQCINNSLTRNYFTNHSIESAKKLINDNIDFLYDSTDGEIDIKIEIVDKNGMPINNESFIIDVTNNVFIDFISNNHNVNGDLYFNRNLDLHRKEKYIGRKVDFYYYKNQQLICIDKYDALLKKNRLRLPIK